MSHRAGQWPTFAFVGVFVSAFVFVATYKRPPDPVADAARAREMAESDARFEAKRAAREATMLDDISKCSTVTDEVRCREAFTCRAEPEDCVFEYGDPDIVLDGIRSDAMNDDSARGDY